MVNHFNWLSLAPLYLSPSHRLTMISLSLPTVKVNVTGVRERGSDQAT